MIPTFVQDSRVGRAIFQVRDDFLFVSARNLGRRIERKIALRSLDPNYETKAIRLYAMLVLALAGALLGAVAIWGILRQHYFPRDALVFVLEGPLIVFGAFIFAGFRWSRRVEYYEFENQWGRPVLSIIREQKQGQDCDEFVAALVIHIELSRSNTSETERADLLEQLNTAGSVMTCPEIGWANWKVSIALGSLAAAAPLAPHAAEYFGALLFLVDFVLCVSGITMVVLSFGKREPGRWRSLVGLVLSLVPPIFY